MKHRRWKVLCLVLASGAVLVTARALAAQDSDTVSDTRSASTARFAVGISLSTPGFPGVVADVRLAGPVSLRGRWYGLVWGTSGRGVGLGLDLLRSSVGNVSAMTLWGELRCVGDADGTVCSNGPGASQAWFGGGTAEFFLAADRRWGFAVEVGRWFTDVGDTLMPGEQASHWLVAGVLKRYF